MDSLATFIVATGALGTAAFGIVEALKWTRVGLYGYQKIEDMLRPLFTTFERAYGADYGALLKAQYRKGRVKGTLSKTLRQGTRIGLTHDNAPGIARWLGDAVIEPETLANIAEQIQQGKELDDQDRRQLGRFELAVDTRIDAALALSEVTYVGSVRVVASMVAVVIALAAGIWIVWSGAGGALKPNEVMLRAILVGVAAVPVAPIAKDLAKAFSSADKAIRVRR